MVQRITSTMMNELTMANISKSMTNYANAINKLSSGNKYSSITENPVASVNIMNTNKQLGQISTFKTNVEMASLELDTLDDILALTTDHLTDARDLAIQANNQTYGDSSLKAIKTEVDEIIKTVVDLANTQYDDKYILSGANTGTPTYSIDDNGNIVYQGTPSTNPDYKREVEVADGVFETINTTGDKTLGCYVETYTDSDGNTLTKQDGKYYDADGNEYTGEVTTTVKSEGLMGALKQFSNSLEEVLSATTDEERAAGYADMNATLDMFNDSLNTITTVQTKMASVNNRMEMSASTLTTTGDNLTAYLSELNDVDYASAVTDLYNAQYAYQASMQIASSTMNMSLLNYMS